MPYGGSHLDQDAHIQKVLLQAEEKEKENERIASILNEQQFKPAVLPLRRSLRSNKGIAPVRYTDTREKDERNDWIEISDKCYFEHKGINCADIRAKHFPEYFNSAKEVIIYLKMKIYLK